MEKQLKEWKEQWNNGDVKFVPELFDLVEEQRKIIEMLKDRKEEVLIESGKRWTKLIKIEQILNEN